MKPQFLKLIAIFLLLPLLFISFTGKPEKAVFSGDWKLNESKSELGQFADFATRSIKAEQKDDAITISRTAPSFQGGENTTTETLSFDGKESESNLFGNSRKKATMKWSEDEQTFVITFTLYLDFNGQTAEVSGTEKWTLEDEGKTLVVTASTSSQFGDNNTRSVFEKQ